MNEDEDAKQKIMDYLASPSHMLMTLATVTPDGKPLAHTVVYVNEGATVYFRSLDHRRKYSNILNNPRVAYTVDEYPGDDWRQLQGVQMEGVATVLTNQAEIDRVTELYLKKVPCAERFVPKTRPGLKVIKIEPVEGDFLDYREAIGHREKVTF